jgi:hypothetical protein
MNRNIILKANQDCQLAFYETVKSTLRRRRLVVGLSQNNFVSQDDDVQVRMLLIVRQNVVTSPIQVTSEVRNEGRILQLLFAVLRI